MSSVSNAPTASNPARVEPLASPSPYQLDTPLIAAVVAHGQRTRGLPVLRVSVVYGDGSELSIPVPVAREPATVSRSPSTWPTPEGWSFRPGEAALNGVRFKIAGKLLSILRELAAHPGEPVTADRLKRQVWGEDPDMVEDGNVQGHVSQLRKRLRDALGLDESHNPITHSDGAYTLILPQPELSNS